MKTEGWFLYVSGCEHGPTLIQYIGEGKPSKPPKVNCSGFNGPWREVELFNNEYCPCSEEEQEFKPIEAIITVVTKPRGDKNEM